MTNIIILIYSKYLVKKNGVKMNEKKNINGLKK